MNFPWTKTQAVAITTTLTALICAIYHPQYPESASLAEFCLKLGFISSKIFIFVLSFILPIYYSQLKVEINSIVRFFFSSLCISYSLLSKFLQHSQIVLAITLCF